MSSFSFIHVSDLHLDSPFSTLQAQNPDLARIMRLATFEAFENVIRICLNNRVDFLVVAGDVYDGADRSLRAQIKFQDGLKKLDDAGIQTFVVHGNHDPLDKWSTNLEWPKRVHIFRDQIKTLDAVRDNHHLACIQGISYPTRDERRNLASLFKRTSEAFHIGLVHANVGSDTGHEPYAPCSMDDLLKPEIDYWALGHVHKHRLLSKSQPVILYPGNTQGRNIREVGEKGCSLVKVNDNRDIEITFHDTDTIRWITREIPIHDIETEQDLINTIDRSCQEISREQSGRPTIARIFLTGEGRIYGFLKEPNALPDLHEIINDAGVALSPSVWIDQIRIHAGPALDTAQLIERQDFIGDLLRYAGETSKNSDLNELMKNELSPLLENARVRRFFDPPNNKKMSTLLKEAERICLHGLYSEEGP